MRQFLEKVIEDVKKGENIELIPTVVFAIAISFLNLMGVTSDSVVSSSMLIILSLLLIGSLANRYKLDKIYLGRDSANTVSLLSQSPPSLQDMIDSANDIKMLGMLLRGTTTNNFYSLKQRASKGARIQAMIVDLNCVNVDGLVERFTRAATTTQFALDFQQVINQYREIRATAPSPDNIQLKLLNHVPSYSIYIFPEKPGRGVMYVEIYGYKSPKGSIPRFQLTEVDHPHWYKHFYDQFHLMWKDASEALLS